MSSPTIRRWALEEIGRNSVRPWTRPRRMASHAFTGGHTTGSRRASRPASDGTGTLRDMERRQVGRSGLRVSVLGLGTMTWGRDTDALDAGEQLRDFLDAGGSLVDTAATYGDGDAERLIGELMTGKVGREDLVLCTKGGVRSGPEGPRADASRGGLLADLDASLGRLGTDHVDLFLVACPDPRTPLEETVSALALAVTSGRARYVGLSNHPAWSAARAATLLEHGAGGGIGIGLAALELEYSLLQRGVERDVVPAAEALG